MPTTSKPLRIALAFLVSLASLALVGCSTLDGSGGASASASPVTDRILASGTIRVGMSGTQPPFSMTDRKGQLIGMDVDLAQGLARTMGVEAKLVPMPFKELLPALERGEVDLVLSGLTMTSERNLKVAFAGPYFVSGKAALTKSPSLAAAKDPTDVKASGRMAVLAGSTSELFARRELRDAELVTVDDYEQAIQMVIDDRVEALIADYPACLLAIYQNPDKGLVTTISTFSFEPIGVALAPEAHLLTNVVQNYLTMLEGTGTLERLRVLWFENDGWVRELP